MGMSPISAIPDTSCSPASPMPSESASSRPWNDGSTLRDRENLTDEEAREYIRQVDEERSRWTRFMYGKNLRDPELFDLCINLERVSFATACSMLQNRAARRVQGNARVPGCRSEPLPLRAFLAALVTNPPTAELEVSARVQDGHVALRGLTSMRLSARPSWISRGPYRAWWKSSIGKGTPHRST